MHSRVCSRLIFPHDTLTLYNLLHLLCMLNMFHVPRRERKDRLTADCLASPCPRSFLRRTDLLLIHRRLIKFRRISFSWNSRDKTKTDPKAFSFFFRLGERENRQAPRHWHAGGNATNRQGRNVESSRIESSLARTRRTRSQWVTLTARRESRPCNSQIGGPIAWSNLRTH